MSYSVLQLQKDWPVVCICLWEMSRDAVLEHAAIGRRRWRRIRRRGRRTDSVQWLGHRLSERRGNLVISVSCFSRSIVLVERLGYLAAADTLSKSVTVSNYWCDSVPYLTMIGLLICNVWHNLKNFCVLQVSYSLPICIYIYTYIYIHMYISMNSLFK